MLNKQDLAQCEKQLLDRKAIIEQKNEEFGLEFEFIKESMSELSNYDNHPGDQGTELFERQKDLALNSHYKTELEAINHALSLISSGNYGICTECGKAIDPERLLAMPTSTTCVNHTEERQVKHRPIEEEILNPNIDEEELENEDQTMFDGEDAWQSVEMYGSSDGPSDFYEDKEYYNDMFYNGNEMIGNVEELEGFLLTDMNGEYIGVNGEHEFYEDYLDEEDIGSIISPEKY
ncbi:YteA family regulatory protein [Gracilibacillus halotolerans]|uniref:YteA family regulatory protein n=1 Tax=Gracilibacillus halotolerans TaxID=74386 RepID=A0A841RJA7_9BACI|nr:TraR/DksA C4-type zinc finger protein [Gracilibacillus halotolerans]MBB6511275.1 YteA family regulatory protein [Gracilibacillus halotolerans]